MRINSINFHKHNTTTPKILNFKGSYSAINKGVQELLSKDVKQEQPFFININNNFLSKFLKQLSDNKDSNFVIGVAGESASGKTTIVNNGIDTIKQNGISCTMLNGDDYYKDVSKKRIEAGSFENLIKSGYSFDKPEAVNLALLKTHLLSLKNGIQIKSPSYDFTKSASTLNVKPKEPARIILHEGLYNLNNDFDNVSDAKIYVKTPFEVMKTRWFDRTAQRGTTGRAAELQFLDTTNKAKKYIYPQENRADIVLNGLSDIEYQKEVINRLIELGN